MMAWLNSPEMARHATRLGGVLRFDTIFPAKLSEIAILVTARHWTSHYEWFAHKRLALKGGMDPKIIDDIRDRRTPVFDDPKGKIIYEVANRCTRAMAFPSRCTTRPSRWSASAAWSKSSGCAAITPWSR